MPPIDLSVQLAGLALQSPLIAAAGTCGYVTELASICDVRTLGAITSKSITAQPRPGNDPWRIIEARAGMLNAIGLANVGLDRFITDKLPHAATLPTRLFVSIAGGSIDEFLTLATQLDAQPAIAAIELNVSCPNTDDGLEFGASPQRLSELLAQVRPAITRAKMIIKLSPNVADITAMAAIAVEHRADALTLINTVSAMAIDVETRQPRLSRGRGGLSGPAIHPIAVRMVHDVYHHIARPAGVPIIGVGGVLDWRDAAEFILAGATAVGLGTALFIDPRRPQRILKDLRRWTERQGCSAISELIGQCTPPPPAVTATTVATRPTKTA